MTQGGSGFSTETMNILSYRQAFEFMELGEASATLIVFFLIVMLIAALTIRNQEQDGGGWRNGLFRPVAAEKNF